MRRATCSLFLVLVTTTASAFLSASSARGETHLFVLSGQSNMAGLNPDLSFTPTVTKGLAGEEVIVVKNARGGQPIRRWYKAWKPASGEGPQADGQLYDALLADVRKAIGEKRPDTVTFVWMQGERDAKSNHGDVYAKSLRGLIGQLETDLDRKDIGVVIGRLSDHLSAEKTPHWGLVREAQVEVAESSPRGAWVDTDDLNGPKDGLHYSREGYVELGRRFATAALGLVALDDLQGTWVAEKAARGEKPAADVVGHRVSFEGNRFRIDSAKGGRLHEGRVRLDVTTDPESIDFVNTVGDDEGTTWLGVYTVADGRLVVRDNAPDPTGPRPTSIEKAAEGTIRVDLVRAAK